MEEMILEKLEGMCNVVLKQESKSVTAMLKDGVKFGLIKGETVFLMDQSGEYQELDGKVIENTDKFLTYATKSFWVASSEEVTG